MFSTGVIGTSDSTHVTLNYKQVHSSCGWNTIPKAFRVSLGQLVDVFIQWYILKLFLSIAPTSSDEIKRCHDSGTMRKNAQYVRELKIRGLVHFLFCLLKAVYIYNQIKQPSGMKKLRKVHQKLDYCEKTIDSIIWTAVPLKVEQPYLSFSSISMLNSRQRTPCGAVRTV
jgi:hypothetical protein